MTVEAVLSILRAIVDQLEERTIERDALANVLRRAGYSPDDIVHVWTDAKDDPEELKRVRQVYVGLREKLGEAGKSSAFEVLLRDFPVKGKAQ